MMAKPSPGIALLTPYNGGNLGDAVIQDAIIANLRQRLPRAQFSGISLNSENFVERHGTGSFPLCASDNQFYRMYYGRLEEDVAALQSPRNKWNPRVLIRAALMRAPQLWRVFRLGKRISRELRHCARGYRFLLQQDLLLVSGGGQLDEEWGGPWGHPFALFKWAVLAKMARVPYVMASVGAGRLTSLTSRFFVSVALRLAQYRSFRDKESRKIAAGLVQRTAGDAVVPDAAFSLPCSELPPSGETRSLAPGCFAVAISVIAYAKPGSWPCPNQAAYDRYLGQMARLVSCLLDRGYLLTMVCSSLGDDDQVIPELLKRLNDNARERVDRQISIPRIRTWKDLTAALRGTDFLVASRLHSTILGFLTQTPTVAISFDPKVDWAMEDLGQTGYLLHIHDFTADDAIQALDRIARHKHAVVKQIGSHRDGIMSAFKSQYDVLARFVDPRSGEHAPPELAMRCSTEPWSCPDRSA